MPGPQDPGIVLQQDDMVELSRYYDEYLDIEDSFSCIKIEGDFESFGCEGQPQIFSMFTTPLQILDEGLVEGDPGYTAAGVDIALIILGQCFGEEQGESTVEFTKVIGSGTETWVDPHPDDYLQWLDNNIAILIPSVNLVDFDGGAGTGPVRVTHGETGNTATSGSLQIDYSIIYQHDGFFVSEQESPNHSIPRSLVDIPKVKYYTYDEEFENFPGAIAAFEDALDQWKCGNSNIGINYISESEMALLGLSDSDIATVGFQDYGPPNENGDVLKATSNTIAHHCEQATESDRAEAFLTSWSIKFNNQIPWFTGEDPSFISESEYDLLTVALHELGHVHSLNHVNQVGQIMYWDVELGVVNRQLVNQNYQSAWGGKFSLLSSHVRLGDNTCQHQALPYDWCGGTSIEPEVGDIKSMFSVHPNPTNGILYLTYHGRDNNTRNQFVIYDIMGQIVYEGRTSSVITSIDVSTFSNGTYVLSTPTVLSEKPLRFQVISY